MTHKRILQDRRRRIISAFLTPVLVDAGFKVNANIYARAIGRLQHIVDVQLSRSNPAGQSSFGLNCGIYIPGVWSGLTNLPESSTPSAADCVIHTKPGLLRTPNRTKWWYMRLSDGAEKDAEIGMDLRAIVEECALPFFDRFPNEATVAKFLSRPPMKEDMAIYPGCESVGVVYAGIIWDQLGEYEKCKECMARAAALAKGKRLEADIEKFAREYVCGKLPRIA